MKYSRHMNSAQMVADSLSSLHTNNLTMFPKAGLNKEERAIVEEESNAIFNEIRSGKLDFVTDTIAAHTIILSNITTVCLEKAKSGGYFKEYTELSIKASDQLRKSGLALAQIKNAIINIENLTIQQQNNIVLLNQEEKTFDTNPIPEVVNVKKVV